MRQGRTGCAQALAYGFLNRLRVARQTDVPGIIPLRSIVAGWICSCELDCVECRRDCVDFLVQLGGWIANRLRQYPTRSTHDLRFGGRLVCKIATTLSAFSRAQVRG